MSPTKLKMQPTIHLERKAGFGRGKNPDLLPKCIVGCIFNSVGLIIARESPSIFIFIKLIVRKEGFSNILNIHTYIIRLFTITDSF
jgi:hypothetical protein